LVFSFLAKSPWICYYVDKSLLENHELGTVIEMATQIKTACEMGAPYASIANALKTRDRVVITDSSGKGESIILSLTEYDALKEAAWERYVLTSLSEVEAVKDDPATWISLDEFWMD